MGKSCALAYCSERLPESSNQSREVLTQWLAFESAAKAWRGDRFPHAVWLTPIHCLMNITRSCKQNNLSVKKQFTKTQHVNSSKGFVALITKHSKGYL